MSLKDKEKWNSKYEGSACLAGREPCSWLLENGHYLSCRGKALDLAMGEGRNALHAASLGYEVLGVDISEVGVRRAEELARAEGLPLQGEVVDLDEWSPPPSTYDLVLCFYFLDRRLFPAMEQALRPGGILVFETFNLDHLKHSSFKKEWVLEHNELLHVFSNLRVLHYQELDTEDKAVSSLVAQKPNHD